MMPLVHQAAVGSAIALGRCAFMVGEQLNILIRIYCLCIGLIAYFLFTICWLQSGSRLSAHPHLRERVWHDELAVRPGTRACLLSVERPLV